MVYSISAVRIACCSTGSAEALVSAGSLVRLFFSQSSFEELEWFFTPVFSFLLSISFFSLLFLFPSLYFYIPYIYFSAIFHFSLFTFHFSCNLRWYRSKNAFAFSSLRLYGMSSLDCWRADYGTTWTVTALFFFKLLVIWISILTCRR